MKNTILALVCGIASAICVFSLVVDSVSTSRRIATIENDLDATIHEHKLGAGPGPLLTGTQWFKSFTRLNEQAFEGVNVPANTATVVYSLPVPTTTEIQVYSGIAIIRYNESDAAVNCDGGACDAVIRRYIPGEYRGGVFCRPDGVCSGAGLTTGIDVPVDTYVPATGLMAGTTTQIVWTGTTLGLQVTCPVACVVAGGLSGQHETDPVLTPQVLSVAQASYATTYSSGVPVTITTSPGAATGVIGATYGGVSLTGCTSSGSSTVTCTLPAGTYTAATSKPVTVTSPSNPTPCATCANFVQSAVTSISPASGSSAGGTAVTITLNAGATGGCTTVPTLNGVATTGCTVVSDTSITATSGAGTAGTGNVVVTSPSTPTALANGWTYGGSPPTLTSLSPNVSSAAGGYVVKGVVTNCTGTPTVTVNGAAATAVTCNSSTQIQFTTPAYSTLNGTSTAQTVTITTSGGSVSSTHGNADSIRYYAANTAIKAHYLGYTLAGGVWTTWPDSTPNALNLTSVGSPTTTTVNGLVAPTFASASSQYANTATAVCTTGPATLLVAGQYTGALIEMAELWASASFGLALGYDNGTTKIWSSDVTTSNLEGALVTSGNLYFSAVVGNGASSFVDLGATQTTGTLNTMTAATALYVGVTKAGNGTLSNYANGPIPEVLVYCGAVANADVQLDYAIIKGTWNTL